jgi:hypothetical protein
MKKLTALLTMSVIFSVQAEELIKNNKYRAKVNLTVKDKQDVDRTAGAQSKFVIVSSDEEKYTIEFMNIYKYKELLPEQNWTEEDVEIEKLSDIVRGERYY